MTIANDDELLSLARESGCVALAVGFESISNQSLKYANKNMGGIEFYKKAILKIHSYKIAIFGLFIFGFDSEDQSILMQHIDLWKKTIWNTPCFRYSPLCPAPNILMNMKPLTGCSIKIGQITIFSMLFSNPCR